MIKFDQYPLYNIFKVHGKCGRYISVLTRDEFYHTVNILCYTDLVELLKQDNREDFHIEPGNKPECLACLTGTCSELRRRRSHGPPF